MIYKKYIFALFFLALLGKLYYNSNPLRRWLRYSKSMEKSKQIGAFLRRYEVEKVEFFPEVPNDIIENLDSLRITSWVEKEVTIEPFLVFFHPKRFTKNEVLIIKSPPKYSEKLLFFRSYDKGHSTKFGRSIVKEKNGKIPNRIVLKFRADFKDLGIVTLVNKS